MLTGDLLGMLVREHSDNLTSAELAGVALLLLIAGHETTANMLTLGTLALLRHADQLAAVRDDPDRLDISRGAAGHVGFGHGVHHCLGAPLARLEMRIAFPALLRRFPSLALGVPDDRIRFRSHSAVYGVEALPVTWRPRSGDLVRWW